MSSPFTGFQNVILKIPDGVGVLAQDEETGNYEYVQTFIDYQAILMLRRLPVVVYSQGVDKTETLVRGYLVSPMNFPVDFKLPATVDCTFSDIEGRETKGTLELDIIPDPFKVGEIAGQKLQGVFRVLGEGNVAV